MINSLRNKIDSMSGELAEINEELKKQELPNGWEYNVDNPVKLMSDKITFEVKNGKIELKRSLTSKKELTNLIKKYEDMGFKYEDTSFTYKGEKVKGSDYSFNVSTYKLSTDWGEIELKGNYIIDSNSKKFSKYDHLKKYAESCNKDRPSIKIQIPLTCKEVSKYLL